MKLSQIKMHLGEVKDINFILPNGDVVPTHFHITEVGVITKDFIDCGGKQRHEKVANFQLWNANDLDHHLKPQKLRDIIDLSERVLGMEDLEIEVEYQSETIGKYALDFNGRDFLLMAKQTACLAEDACGISPEKQKVELSEIKASNTCKPGGGCC